MLDWLPRPELPADFASQTLTRIHSQQLQAEQLEARVKVGATILVKALASVACIVVICSIGFMALRHAWPDPSRQLINDLDIAENLESYRAIPDIKFLDDLSRLGIFADSVVAPESGAEAEANPGGA